MDIKLIMKYISIGALFFIVGCSTQSQQLIEQRKSWHYQNWKQDFKDRTFCLCLLEGYQNKDLHRKIVEIDNSYYNAIATALFDSIISMNLKDELKKMKTDSIYRIEHVSESGQGKRIFNHCLKYYKSKKLDSIAKMESLKWRKIRDIDSLVMEKIPAY